MPRIVTYDPQPKPFKPSKSARHVPRFMSREMGGKGLRPMVFSDRRPMQKRSYRCKKWDDRAHYWGEMARVNAAAGAPVPAVRTMQRKRDSALAKKRWHCGEGGTRIGEHGVLHSGAKPKAAKYTYACGTKQRKFRW